MLPNERPRRRRSSGGRPYARARLHSSCARSLSLTRAWRSAFELASAARLMRVPLQAACFWQISAPAKGRARLPQAQNPPTGLILEDRRRGFLAGSRGGSVRQRDERPSPHPSPCARACRHGSKPR